MDDAQRVGGVSVADFLLELRSEEIPARMQAKAAADLAHLLSDYLTEQGVEVGGAKWFVTPRRLAFIAYNLPLTTTAKVEEIKGPRASAPPQALEGFLRKTGVARDQLVERDGVLFAIVAKPGRPTADVIAEAVPAVIRAFPWPKSMRWGAASDSTASLRWVRPLQGIVALLGDDVVPFEIDGIESGAATVGHRFHHPGQITIGKADDYAAKLRACHVIIDPAERMAIIRDRGAALAAEAGLSVVPDDGLVAENAGLTEWPVPLLGRFDPDFLSVPREVIQLTLRTNQKYFVLNDADGKLAPAFLITANIDAADGGAAIVAGNGKVLSARLADARFFYEQDLKTPLRAHAEKLKDIVFHEKLGTVADKVERVAKLAEWLAREGIVPGCDPALARAAAELCKADLVTGMVGEFPELQGVMGGYYARAEGLPAEVADAIRDHYKPVGQGDDVPTAPVTVAVSLADKLDTIAAFFGMKELPTGSRDPYGLRRTANGVIQIISTAGLLLPLKKVVQEAAKNLALFAVYRSNSQLIDATTQFHKTDSVRLSDLSAIRTGSTTTIIVDGSDFMSWTYPVRNDYPGIDINYSPADQILNFFADRLKVQQREAGVRHDLIDAVFALGGEDDLVRLLARVKALQAFVGTADGANLLAGYKRAANILRKEGGVPEGAVANPSPPPAEAALIAALDTAEPRAEAAIAAEDFEGTMAALASLRGPIDTFFEGVTVNDPDPATRAARLALLARVRDAVHRVADFSKIEG